jgi:hypothetical protein
MRAAPGFKRGVSRPTIALGVLGLAAAAAVLAGVTDLAAVGVFAFAGFHVAAGRRLVRLAGLEPSRPRERPGGRCMSRCSVAVCGAVLQRRTPAQRRCAATCPRASTAGLGRAGVASPGPPRRASPRRVRGSDRRAAPHPHRRAAHVRRRRRRRRGPRPARRAPVACPRPDVQQLAAASGELWEYSKRGPTLLAAIVEQVTGHRFAEVLHDRVFTPLGLARAFATAEAAATTAPLATGHELWFGRWRPDEEGAFPSPTVVLSARSPVLRPPPTLSAAAGRRATSRFCRL